MVFPCGLFDLLVGVALRFYVKLDTRQPPKGVVTANSVLLHLTAGDLSHHVTSTVYMVEGGAITEGRKARKNI